MFTSDGSDNLADEQDAPVAGAPLKDKAMPRIAVLGVDGAHLASLAAVLDMFELANRYSTRQYEDREELPAPFTVKLIGAAGTEISLLGGRSLRADGDIRGSDQFDLVYVAAFELGRELDLKARMAGLGEAAVWVARQKAAGAVIAASGAGVALLAEAGLLHGEVAAMPWWLERPFHRRYPDVEIDTARDISQSGDLYCAGSARAELALAHRLVERLASPNVAHWLAKITLVDPYPDGPPPWALFSPKILREDPLVGRAQHWLQLRFSQKPRLKELAETLAVSERTLVRRFEASIGMTPLDYLQLLRVEAAKQMLTRSLRRVDRISYLVGYSDPGYFKKVFRTHTGMTPSQFRHASAADDPHDESA